MFLNKGRGKYDSMMLRKLYKSLIALTDVFSSITQKPIILNCTSIVRHN
jgi:hypothetical protein